MTLKKKYVKSIHHIHTLTHRRLLIHSQIFSSVLLRRNAERGRDGRAGGERRIQNEIRSNWIFATQISPSLYRDFFRPVLRRFRRSFNVFSIYSSFVSIVTVSSFCLFFGKLNKKNESVQRSPFTTCFRMIESTCGRVNTNKGHARIY